MSYGIMGYRVDLDLLAKKIGLPERARIALQQDLMPQYSRSPAGSEEEFMQGISALLVGPPYAKNYSDGARVLSHALESFCRAYGASLYNNPVSPFKGSFLEDVGAHLGALGSDVVRGFIYRGAPLGLPRAESPMVGHLTNSEIEALLPQLQSQDLSAQTEPLLKLAPFLQQSVIRACEMFREWLTEAKIHGQGLVSFHA